MKQAVIITIGAIGAVAVLWTVRTRTLTVEETVLPVGQKPTVATPKPVAPTGPPPKIDFEATQKRFNEEIAKSPSNFDLRMQAATFYTVENAHPQALVQLKEAVKLKPDSLVAWIAMGDAGTMAKEYVTAESAYVKAEMMSPGNALIFRGRGQMHLLRKEFKQARAIFEAGVAKHPKDTELRFALASLLLIMNFPRDAATTMEPAVALEPNRPEFHYVLGEAYERDLHMERATEQMELAVKLAPDYVQAWGRLGLYRKDLTRFAPAREALLKAISLNPKESFYFWALGECYQLDPTVPDGVSKATESFNKALELNAKNEKALYAYGMLLSRKGAIDDLKKAASLFERLLKLKPEDMNVEYKLAEFYTRTGRNDLAAQHRAKFQVLFNKGRDQNVEIYQKQAFLDTAGAHAKLGVQYLQKRDFKMAVKEFQFALERDPKLKSAQEGLATAQHSLENRPAQ